MTKTKNTERQRREMTEKILRAVERCVLAQDYLSLERIYSRLADGYTLDEAIEVVFGDALVTASNAELTLAAHVADYVLACPGRVPWRA